MGLFSARRSMLYVYEGLVPAASTVLRIVSVSPGEVRAGGSSMTMGVSQLRAHCAYPCALLKCAQPVVDRALGSRSGVSPTRASGTLLALSADWPRRAHMAKVMELSSPADVILTVLVVSCLTWSMSPKRWGWNL
jgi:hypothetical protein